MAVSTQTDGDNRLVAGRYRLTRKLGTGGMGVVWQAYDERLHRQVAVKQLLLPAGLTEDEAAQAKQRIMREGRIAARLQHPHAIMVYDVAEDGGRPYLIMEYLPSMSLADILAERGTLPPHEAARIGADIASALATAHAAGVVHRDIKPGNVLLGEDGLVKITDFGISRAVEDITGTLTSAIIGTPAYLSPEVARGDRAGFASDVYSLGSTLYTAVEGAPPFGLNENAIALLYRVSSGQFTPPVNAGPLTDALLALLRAAPDQRPTMAEASEALAEVASTADTDPSTADATKIERIPTAAMGLSALFPATPAPFEPPPPPSPPMPPDPGPVRPIGDGDGRNDAPPSDRRKRLAVLAAAAIALLGLLAAIFTIGNRDQAGGNTAASQQPTSTTAGEPTTSQAPAQPPPPSTKDTATTPPTRSPASPTTTAAPPTQPPPGSGQSPPAAIVAYYALMPGNLQEGWTRLTPRYQANTARGFDGYQAFWGQMSGVQVSEVSPGSGDRVDATIVYNFRTGKVVRERHSYSLVSQQGQWLIDGHTVLSSDTL
jgi:eukaryotic-like serine/threonine-protein kinase